MQQVADVARWQGATTITTLASWQFGQTFWQHLQWKESGSWIKSIFPLPNSDPVQNYSLNFKNLKEENLAQDSRMPTTSRLVRAMFQVIQATRRRLVQTLSVSLPAKRPFFHTKNQPRGSGRLFPPFLRMKELCQYKSPKWLQEWCVSTIKMNDHLMPHFIVTR